VTMIRIIVKAFPLAVVHACLLKARTQRFKVVLFARPEGRFNLTPLVFWNRRQNTHIPMRIAAD